MSGHPLQQLLTAARYVAGSTNAQRSRIADRLVENASLSASDVIIQDSWMMSVAAWYENGANVFELTDSLVAALLLTSLPGNCWPDSIPAPFDAFLIRIPDGFIRQRDVATQDRWCRYIAVTASRGRFTQFSDTGLPWKGYFFFVTSGLSLDGPCDETSNDWCVVPSTIGPIEAPYFPLQGELQSHAVGVLALVRRLVVGFCSWLASKPAGGAGPRSGGGSTRSVERPNVIVAGRELKLSRELRDAARDLGAAAQGNPRPGWKLKFKHVVRGHWRNQAVGPHRAEHRMTWIAPYWKGPEGAAAWSHIYKDKAP